MDQSWSFFLWIERVRLHALNSSLKFAVIHHYIDVEGNFSSKRRKL